MLGGCDLGREAVSYEFQGRTTTESDSPEIQTLAADCYTSSLLMETTHGKNQYHRSERSFIRDGRGSGISSQMECQRARV